MRRFIAYILASITILLGVGVAFKPIATKINTDISYRDGKQITLKLTNRDDEKQPIEDEKAAIDYAKIVETRLKAYGNTDYKIVTHGNDTITVTLTASNDAEYTSIGNLLAINPKIEIDTAKDSYPVSDTDGSFSWHETNAYLTYEGSSTILIKPIPASAKEKVGELIKKAKEEEGSKSTNADPEPAKEPSIALWMNRNEGERYADKSKDRNIASKIIFEFRSDTFYRDSNNDSFQIAYKPVSNSPTDIRNSYNQALYSLNLLNASETTYNCTVLHIDTVPATVEPLLIYGAHVRIAMSSTFIALLVTLILISLILALFYRLGAIAIISTSTLFAFLSFMVFVFFKPIFNIAALTGIIGVFLSSIFIGVAYNHYVHEEVYKGRSLKKANYEASKKTTLLTIDISVIMMLIGLLMFFIGGTTVHSFGIMFIIGSVLNLFINTFILKGLMWLLTNANNVQKNYKYLNIKGEVVPDLSKEEKPSYFGPYEGRNFTKRKKLSAIIFSSLLIASLVGIITFSVTSKTIFNAGDYFNVTNQVRVKINQDADLPKPNPPLKETLDKVINTNTGKTFSYNANIADFSYQYFDSVKKQEYIDYYYIIDVTEKDVNASIYSYNGSPMSPLDDTLSIALKDALFNEDVIIRKTQAYNLPSNANFILLAMIIANAVCSFYLWIRYRASRALTLFIMSSSIDVIAIGILTLTRLVATPVMAVGVGLTSTFVLLAGLYILHKDKDLIRDERVRNNITRQEVLKKATWRAFAPLSIFAIASIFVSLIFFGFGSRAFNATFFMCTLAIIATVFMIMTLFNPIANFFDERFMRIKLPKIKRKKKKAIKNNSGEPSEAIFIGIND